MISFSVVTPSFNQGMFIERTIRSVLEQGYPDLEYVICDNCSTDCTADILAHYASRATMIRERDSGQADAVNKGIRATSGEVIGWLNSDDMYEPGALMTVAGYLAQHPEVDVVYGDAKLIDAEDRITGRYYTEPWNPKRLALRPFLCQPAVFFRRRLVDKLGDLDEQLHYAMDYEYWLRLVRGGARFAYLPATLASARQHSQAKTFVGGSRITAEISSILKGYLQRVPDSWILTHTHAVLAEREIRWRSPLELALAVSVLSLRSSIEMNGSVTPGLVLSSLRTLGAGVGKSALGRPVLPPVD